MKKMLQGSLDLNQANDRSGYPPTGEKKDRPVRLDRMTPPRP
jgi:hypothetical protein